jgi:pantetheine-phosphate adenylyltransferase
MDEIYINAVLKKYTITTLSEIKAKYNEEGRFYHNFEHIEYMFNKMEETYDPFETCLGNPELVLGILFHDYVLNDEDASITAFSKLVRDEYKMSQEIISAYRMIGATKDHVPNDVFGSELLINLDLAILREPLDKLIEYEHKIFKEYQHYDYSLYKKGRIIVLESLESKHGLDLTKLKDYIIYRVPNIAIYAGSFNPFHAGHYNILQKAEKIFDKVIIARGYNYNKPKKDKLPMPKIVENRQYIEYNSLLSDVIESLEYSVTVIRGVRTGEDVNEDIETMKRFDTSAINFVHIIGDREFEYISSSEIRKNMLLDF